MNDTTNGRKPFSRKWIVLSLIAFPILAAVLIYGILILTMPDVEILKKQNPGQTALMQLRIQAAAEKGRRFRVKQQWVAFSQIPELMKKTVRISEDANFYFHEGIDLDELEESIKRNLEEGDFIRGGSTITQQLAKNLYLSTEKSLWRKIREYLIARELETHLSKNRIYQIYLNVIEFGNGIFGVGAAAEYFFHKPVGELSSEEIIRLTAIIPRPLKTNPTEDSKWLLWRCRWITKKLLLYKYIEQQEYDYLIIRFTIA
ncbi:MAG: monofunctional biosynthetic peptidoglycan transglycosylase [Calditrichales bacterium]|nr:MAG: monofunctional biosynthetic peptidoglycan transglycosylase [Calditrichales bacterium]